MDQFLQGATETSELHVRARQTFARFHVSQKLIETKDHDRRSARDKGDNEEGEEELGHSDGPG